MATKISLIGAGNIGGTIALLAAIKNLGNIVLIDIAKGLAKGKALDISHSLPVLQCNRQITGTASLKQMKDSKIIVITAGFPRKEGMSRDDLVEINLKVMKTVGADHLPILTTIEAFTKKKSTTNRYFWNFKKADWTKLVTLKTLSRLLVYVSRSFS